jgi:hypothetical protein
MTQEMTGRFCKFCCSKVVNPGSFPGFTGNVNVVGKTFALVIGAEVFYF